jgi:hypothetical protein
MRANLIANLKRRAAINSAGSSSYFNALNFRVNPAGINKNIFLKLESGNFSEVKSYGFYKIITYNRISDKNIII